MTFSILNTTINKVIDRSNVRLAGDFMSPNLRIDYLTTPKIVKSRHLPSSLNHGEEGPTLSVPNDSTSSSNNPMPIIDPNDIVVRTFLIPQEDD